MNRLVLFCVSSATALQATPAAHSLSELHCVSIEKSTPNSNEAYAFVACLLTATSLGAMSSNTSRYYLIVVFLRTLCDLWTWHWFCEQIVGFCGSLRQIDFFFIAVIFFGNSFQAFGPICRNHTTGRNELQKARSMDFVSGFNRRPSFPGTWVVQHIPATQQKAEKKDTESKRSMLRINVSPRHGGTNFSGNGCSSNAPVLREVIPRSLECTWKYLQRFSFLCFLNHAVISDFRWVLLLETWTRTMFSLRLRHGKTCVSTGTFRECKQDIKNVSFVARNV